HTYDWYTVRPGGMNLGCFDGGTSGGCADSDANNVYEGAGLVFDYFWDTAFHNALADTNLPNPANLDFTKGFGGADFNIGHYSPDPNDAFDGNDRARIYLTANSVTVAVPEPETYAMMLAGLGLVGFAARRRAAQDARGMTTS
ncbi:MAG: motif, partial [Proteobacteria bacterium]|nr:motif [Pseudomonadota bacterium]